MAVLSTLVPATTKFARSKTGKRIIVAAALVLVSAGSLVMASKAWNQHDKGRNQGDNTKGNDGDHDRGEATTSAASSVPQTPEYDADQEDEFDESFRQHPKKRAPGGQGNVPPYLHESNLKEYMHQAATKGNVSGADMKSHPGSFEEVVGKAAEHGLDMLPALPLVRDGLRTRYSPPTRLANNEGLVPKPLKYSSGTESFGGFASFMEMLETDPNTELGSPIASPFKENDNPAPRLKTKLRHKVSNLFSGNSGSRKLSSASVGNTPTSSPMVTPPAKSTMSSIDAGQTVAQGLMTPSNKAINRKPVLSVDTTRAGPSSSPTLAINRARHPSGRGSFSTSPSVGGFNSTGGSPSAASPGSAYEKLPFYTDDDPIVKEFERLYLQENFGVNTTTERDALYADEAKGVNNDSLVDKTVHKHGKSKFDKIKLKLTPRRHHHTPTTLEHTFQTVGTTSPTALPYIAGMVSLPSKMSLATMGSKGDQIVSKDVTNTINNGNEAESAEIDKTSSGGLRKIPRKSVGSGSSKIVDSNENLQDLGLSSDDECPQLVEVVVRSTNVNAEPAKTTGETMDESDAAGMEAKETTLESKGEPITIGANDRMIAGTTMTELDAASVKAKEFPGDIQDETTTDEAKADKVACEDKDEPAVHTEAKKAACSQDIRNAFIASKVAEIRIQTDTEVVEYAETDLRPKHPNHHRTFYSKNLKCTTHEGVCAVCKTPCCVYADTVFKSVDWSHENGMVAAQLLVQSMGLWIGEYGPDLPTFLECTECHKKVCPHCIGFCPIEQCQDRTCRKCNRKRQWKPCDWHDTADVAAYYAQNGRS